jgi:hypothetical protein
MQSYRSRVRESVRGLFPEPAPSRKRVIFWYVAGFVAAMGYLVLIPAGRSRLGHIWAEDGARFLLDAETMPLWRTLFLPYKESGYLHTIPRLGAEVVTYLPLSWAAAGLAITAAALRAGIALVVFASSSGYLRSKPLRFGLAALIVVAPVGNSEAVDNFANFHWFALIGAFWLLLWRPTARWQVALSTVALFLAATSSPLIPLLAPLALARFAIPGWRQRIVTLGFLLGVAVQATAMVLSPRYDHFHRSVDVGAAALGALARVPLVAFTGSEDIERYYALFDYWPFVGALTIILVLAVVAFRWGGPPRAMLAAAALSYAALIIWLSLSSNWHWDADLSQPSVVLDGQRYSVTPCLLVLTVIAVGLDCVPAVIWRRVATAIVGVVLVVGAVRQLPGSTGTLTGITWQQSVITARHTCALGWPAATLQLSPSLPGNNWTVELPCRVLT